MPGGLHRKCGCLAVAVSNSKRMRWGGGGGRGLSSGKEERLEEKGTGVVEGEVLVWAMQKVRLQGCGPE